jgi:endonuclease IV
MFLSFVYSPANSGNQAGAGNVLGSKFAEIACIIHQVEDKSRIGVCLDTCSHFVGFLRHPSCERSFFVAFRSYVRSSNSSTYFTNDRMHADSMTQGYDIRTREGWK